jgi:hypothetical protein
MLGLCLMFKDCPVPSHGRDVAEQETKGRVEPEETPREDLGGSRRYRFTPLLLYKRWFHNVGVVPDDPRYGDLLDDPAYGRAARP